MDTLVCLGDIVGYNPYPRQCIELVQENADLVLQGNHDRDLSNKILSHYNEDARTALEYTRNQLTEEAIDYLWGLPAKADIPGTGFMAAHSHPTKIDEYVMPRDFPRIRPFLDNYEGIFIGHTHIQHRARIDNRLIVNPGSVGQPRDQDPRAAYAVYNTETDELDLRRVEYDIHQVHEKIEEEGLPSSLGERLYEGR